MISQYNVVYTIEILKRSIDFDDFVGMRVVSYLPMAHIAERAVSHYQSMMLGYSVYCCPDPNQLTMYLKEVHPQLAFGVPRVWEKIYNGVNAALAADPDRKAQFDDGVNAAIEIRRSNLDGDFTDEQQATLDFLDSVAFSNVRALVGLDAVELAITGAAPIPVPVLEWFNAIGVPLAEIYGMSETTGPMTFSPERPKIGTVGRGCHGMEVQIADDGEVICRGGNVFEGYFKQPDKTAETLVDGWLHSGDIGEIDDEGYIKIVDRKKELIITSGGKNISPANLEAALKTIPLIGQAAAIGDARKFVSAILVLDPEAAVVWAKVARQGVAVAGRTRRRRRRDRRGAGRHRRGQPAVRPGRADQEVHPRRRGVDARQRHADADLEAQAARRQRPLRRRDRGDVRLSRRSITQGVRPHAVRLSCRVGRPVRRCRTACRAHGRCRRCRSSSRWIANCAWMRASVADVHLAPQPAAGAGEFDLDRPQVGARNLPVPGDPAFLLEPIEPTTQARRRQPQVGGDVERPGTSAETLERGEHVEPSERDVPVGAQLLVEPPFDLTDERLQAPPRSDARRIEAGHRR